MAAPSPSPSNTETMLQEHRSFPPPPAFAAGAHLSSIEQYEALHARSLEDPDGFWAEVAADLHWFRKWDRVLRWEAPDPVWFGGAKTNLCFNCLDRQVDAGLGDRPAILWEAEAMGPDGAPIVESWSYAGLLEETSRCANALKAMGVKKGDVVTIYMGMVPQLAIAMLACARIGAVHSVIFGGFSAAAIADRVVDGNSRFVITCDGSYRRGRVVPLKATVEEALQREGAGIVTDVLVYRRTRDADAPFTAKADGGRDHDWAELVHQQSDDCPAEEMDAEDPLFILYTSGSTGKPKGILHTTAGYMVWAYLTSRLTFDLAGHGDGPRRAGRAGDDRLPWSPGPVDRQSDAPVDIYWCTADCGWITGHSYIVYGLLPNRVPTLMYEGAPDFPAKDRFWDIVERHRVTKFYTAPTAIRAFMKWGDEHVEKHDLSTLRVLGTVGEPINPEAWMWYREKIGGGTCPIVDTWWQTETGGHMLTPLPGATTAVPGSCGKPMLGVSASVVREDGRPAGVNEGGMLVIDKPWPGMLRGIHGDRQRFVDTYWSAVEGKYCPADGARRDENGNFWIMGRTDDVIVVAGHNLGTMEVESALVAHARVAEAAVVGFPHEVKGNGIAAFVIPHGDVPAPGSDGEAAERDALIAHVGRELGPIARPDQIRFTPALPKTRSGKIMRRLLRSVAAGEEVTSDVSTLEDPAILDKLLGR
ncbi:acetate--CoA ligase [Phycisphaera mikurensis]|uniref:acetate--CoA ligase n=1 Tax=Phycisphaera mikurensis (strain NBRC 102666 / KCTC 22515 / FYK2301M01) TaxID=1142394 RepID=I0IGM2_PHYMF|nr:acetate--CoA ligase [Phycisphaera mikurensis]MBB6442908.1 acetyl-CoA synthetase [Phycisphaera mikurensis]BAM04410.1 acetyl-coenzyme A synthetase [Phycisphaera mikurensis NBRC 102666]